MTRSVALLVACATLLAACGPFAAQDASRVHDIAGFVPDLRLAATDDHGRAVDAGDFRGRPALVYFGFTHCEDVCPTTLAHLARAADAARASDVRILFVTVDPARDTTPVLEQYARAFGPRVTGLRAAPGELESLARRYRVSYGLGKPDARGDYEVSHSSGTFGFDREGHARVLILPDASAAEMREAISALGAAPAS